MLVDEQQQKDELQLDQIQNAEDYVKAVKAMKANMVDKTEYDKVVEEKAVLVRAIAEGQTTSDEGAQEAEKYDIAEGRKKFLASDESLTNAEYIENVLKLRSAIIAEGGLDPFLPSGQKIQPDVNDIKGANKVAEALQSCLDSSRGEDGKVDPELFNAHLSKIIAPDSAIMSARMKTQKR